MTDGSGALPPISKGALRSARRLLSRRARDEAGQFLAEGAQAVREAGTGESAGHLRSGS